MKKLIFIMMLCCFVIAANAQPPNNPIFYGGDGDGLSKSSYQQNFININFGGDGDGFVKTSFQQASTNINLGGDGDGWYVSSYLQKVDSAIFYGGDGDSWIVTNYLQKADSTIFYGGDGDGWSSIVYSLGPLPVELLSFTGREVNDEHVLDWKTTSEINTSHFVIEHSTNATSFLELGMKTAAGNSHSILNYSFTNKKPVEGYNFYRLKMVDVDGKFKYSNVVLLTSLGVNEITLYPNPSASILNVDMKGELDNSTIQMKVIDINGKTIWDQQFQKNNMTYQIDISHFANGMYQLIILNKNDQKGIKFRKMN